MVTSLTVDTIIATLDLAPHPEGGHYRETWRSGETGRGGRSAGTSILFLLGAGERSHWHRVDADELWFHHAGAPLRLSIAGPDGVVATTLLGADVVAGEHQQALVPAHAWQSATTTGDWTLLSCVVVPGFDFAGFELAPPDWMP